MALELVRKYSTVWCPQKNRMYSNGLRIKVDDHVITNDQVIVGHFNEVFVNAASKALKPSHI